jgi:uncharacterized protein YraI
MNKLYGFRFKWVSWSLAGLMFFFTIFPPGSAWAQRKYTPKKAGPTKQYGKVVKVLPVGHRVVSLGKVKYHYGNGIFYQAKGRHWIVVRPPIGAVVAGLAATAILVTVSGSPYYLYEGIYYRKVPAGYEVVEVVAPATTTATIPGAGERVQVTTLLLNIRSGPGMHHGVVRSISQGTILTVKGSAPSWLYVELEDGTQGWVMKTYTIRVQSPAQG